jgi:hypothetical protein
MRRSLLFIAMLLVLFACACPGPRELQQSLPGTPDTTQPRMLAPAPPAVTIITELRGPECTLHDPEQDLYFISNVNGSMLTIDGNGFISRVDPKTLQVDLKWIESGRNGVTLDAPKGMAVLGNALYVSDITGVRKFDRRSGAPLGLVPLPGATFINDIATDGKSLYVSDTGVRIGPGRTFPDAGTQAIWKIANDRAEKIASGPELGHPNGLDVANGKLRAITFGSNRMYELDGGKKKNEVLLPRGELDGLVHLADGSFLVTSWEGSEIYRGPANGPFHAILAGLSSPADIGYDAKRHRLLVPQAGLNQVTIHDVQ